MDIPTILAALTGHSVTSEDLRVLLVQGLSMAPLLPALALALVAAYGGGHRGSPTGGARAAAKASSFTRRPGRVSRTAESGRG